MNLDEIPEVIAIRKKADEQILVIKKNEKLKNIVCQYFGFKWKRIIAKGRPREYSDAMYIYVYIAYHELKYKLNQIAATCGNRHHTSIINGLKRIECYYDSKDALIFDLEAIKAKFKTSCNEEI